jgi:hypothetical protein
MKSSQKTAILIWIFVVLTGAYPACAQISIGTNGSGTLTFTSFPTVASGWSTLSVGTFASTFISAAALDAAVASNSLASAITNPLGNNGTGSSLLSGTANWNSLGLYLQSRPSGNDYVLLMATLRNDAGTNVTRIRVSYDWDQKMPTPVNEQIPGHRAFYSFSGQRGSWNLIPTLSTFTTTSLAQVVTADISIGTWTNGGFLYLLWADDNGAGGSVNPQEGSYSIDNFSVKAVNLSPPAITRHPESQTVAPNEGAVLSIDLFGAEPFFYRWFRDGNLLVSATNAVLEISNATVADQGYYFVAVSNSFGTTTSSNAFLTVTCATAVAVSTQPVGRITTEGSSFSLGVGTSGTPPIRYQWQRNGMPIPGQTNSTLLFSNVQTTDTAFYSVSLQNCGGTAISTSVLVSVASAPIVLLHLTNKIWKYNDIGEDLGSSWRAPNYDDSWWPSGRGVFAFENNAVITALSNTVLSLTNASGAQFITYYFRTSFTLTNSPSDVLLVSSNYIDDGAVIYVNGLEAFRFNLPEGPLSSSTLASSANPLGEGVPFVSNLPSGLILQGTNTIGVEVRQNSMASSDVVFGVQLTAVPLAPTSLAFTGQPQDIMALEGSTINFSAAVDGNNARFQWFKDGNAINGATGPSLSLNNVNLSDAGSYLLRAGNILGSVYSRLATLTVLLDRTPPVLVSADLLDPFHVLASFSEAVQVSNATNPANYTVTNSLGTAVSVMSIVVTNQTNVLLRTTAMGAGQNFILTARGVADDGPAHNVSSGSAVPIARRLQLIAFDSMWDFFDPYPPLTDATPGENWKLEGYDTSDWGNGASAFSLSNDGQFVPPLTVHTTLSSTPVYTSYYRNSFFFQGSPGGLTLSLRYAFDDAVVLYLNGEELHRTNLPPGIISPQTPAVAVVGGAVLSSNLIVSSQFLRAGPNLFAAEVHQATTNDGDKFFASELGARVESLVTGPVLILSSPTNTTVTESTPATFVVQTVGAATFQWLMNGTNLPGATNATLRIGAASLALNGTTFGLVAHGPGGTVQSSNATLRVLPDLERPEFLAAMGINNTLTLTFSEFLDPTSAENPANYMVTNSGGALLAIENVTLVDGTNVVLQFGSLPFGRYGVVVNDVRDTSAAANVIRANSAVLSGYSGLLLPVDASWRYFQAGTSPGTNWQQAGFDDVAWLSGAALFYTNRNGNIALPEPIHTALMLSNVNSSAQVITYYFRTEFQSANSGNATLSIRYLADDGLVLYLNGAEFHRRRMPAGLISYSTFANASVGDVTYEGPIMVQATNIAIGTNLFAVEVHQVTASSADVGFALEVRATLAGERILAEPAIPPTLRLFKWGGQYALTWDDPAAALESSESVDGPWFPLLQSNPAFVSATNHAAFYRLRR